MLDDQCMSTRRTRRSPWPDRIAVAKDLILFGVGIALIIHQGFVVPAPDFNLSQMIFGGVTAGAPGAMYLWQQRSATPPPIGGSRSEDLPPPSAQLSPLPSSDT
jgi:hypothetical protein